MLSEREVSAAIGSTAYGIDGDKLGKVEHFFVDDRTAAPTWVSITTGPFGTRHSIVPAVDAVFDGGSLRLPVAVEAVRSAPRPAGDHLDPDEEAALRRHYGLGDTGPDATGLRDDHRALDRDAMAAPTQEGSIVPPPPADAEEPDPAAPGGMVRSEERLVAGTERVAATRARLVKYVVTEEVQLTVPIRREEIRLEQVPLDAPDPGPGETLLPADQQPAGDRPATGGHPESRDHGAGGLPDEIVLHAERPVVGVEVVPVERVRLRIETVPGQEQVTERVQREQIVVDETPSPDPR